MVVSVIVLIELERARWDEWCRATISRCVDQSFMRMILYIGIVFIILLERRFSSNSVSFRHIGGIRRGARQKESFPELIRMKQYHENQKYNGVATYFLEGLCVLYRIPIPAHCG